MGLLIFLVFTAVVGYFTRNLFGRQLVRMAEGWVDRSVEQLRERGHIYEDGGATWFRSTTFGDDKDRVLVKSDGEYTYFASDTAYYVDKRERGFDTCLYLLGADHHGYVARVRAGLFPLRHSARASGSEPAPGTIRHFEPGPAPAQPAVGR